MRFRFLCFGPALGRADRAARHMAHNNTITAALRDVLSSAPRARRVHARVDMIEPTGADTMAMLTFAGTEIVARMDAEFRPAVGVFAELSLDLRKACLFDPATQRRFA